MRQDTVDPKPAEARPQRSATPAAWLMLSPLLAWVLAFVVAPTLLLLVYSFCRRGMLGGVVYEFTLDNYAAVLDPTYLRIFVRSIVYSAATTAMCLVLAYPVAYFIGRAPPSRRGLLILLVMIPFWTSFVIRTYAWLTILKSEGLLNSLLVALGMISSPLEMLYTPGAVLLGLVYTFLPFMILPIYSSVEKLDPALIEAASDLGATPGRVFSRIIVPLTWPGISAGALLVFVPALGLYAVNDILGGGKVDMIGNIIENQFKNARNWPFGAALGMTLVAAFATALWLTNSRQPREARSGVSA
ncbi:MAG TPA: ABC transporter permease [Candidatus Limnocylindrales bacterium]|nr:ABC transporter permease [Candidatus Limnocylindrales bacterium]